MAHSIWNCAGQQAELTGGLCGHIDLARPHEGIALTAVAGKPLEGCRLTAIALDAATDVPPCDCHVRGCDLVVAYGDSAARPVAVDVIWRTLTDEAGEITAGLDVVVSVRTPLLESRPTLTLASTVTAEEVWRLTDATSGTFVAVPRSDAQRMLPVDGPSCVLFRLPGGRLSYAEMVYPPDFQRDELTLHDPKSVALRHEVFGPSLEKGVILRCRLRGVFVSRRGDQQAAAACYRRFAAAEPFLGT